MEVECYRLKLFSNPKHQCISHFCDVLGVRNFGPQVIFVLGGPGAGKGTQYDTRTSLQRLPLTICATSLQGAPVSRPTSASNIFRLETCFARLCHAILEVSGVR